MGSVKQEQPVLVVASAAAGPACRAALAAFDVEVEGELARVLVSHETRAFAAVVVEAREAPEQALETVRRLRLVPGREHGVIIAVVESHASAGAFLHVGADDIALGESDLALRTEVALRLAHERAARARVRTAGRWQAGELEALFAQLPVFLLTVDESGAITFINRGGVPGSPEQIVGTPARDFLRPEDRPLFEAAMASVRSTHAPCLYETCVHGTDYEVRVAPLLREGVFIGATLVTTDVTERRRAEAALRASEERLRAFLEALPDLYFRLSGDGVLLDVHAGQQAELVAPAVTLVGQRLESVLPERLASQVSVAVRTVLSERRPVVIEYQLAVAPDATHFEARLAPAADDEVIAIVRNTTERRRLEAQLRLSDRLAAIGTLAAGVAHEINNPLAYVLLNLGYLARALDRDVPAAGAERAQLAACVADALDGVERVRRIVGDLRTVARPDEPTSRSVDLTEVLQASVHIAAATARQARFELRAGPTLRVQGDPAQLGQVFLNLLVNAAQAVASLPLERRLVEVRARALEESVTVEVVDRGPGIAPALVDRVFDPFFTTKPTGEGSGLGLWICRRIVESRGGTLRLTTREGEGTTFTVTLPAGAAPGEATTPRASPPPPPEEALRGRLLIVDDEPRVARAIALALPELEATTAESVVEAAAALAGAPFDVVVSDVTLADGTAAEVLAAAERRDAAYARRFVLVTGHDEGSEALGALGRRGLSWLRKPVDEEALRGAVRSALAAGRRGPVSGASLGPMAPG